MNTSIPYGKQHIDAEDIESVIDVLKSDYLTQGPKVNQFEKDFSDYVKSDYACAVSNGTTALHLCAIALGVKKGSKVICPTLTFAASANCIKYCGGEVIFCDIDPKTYLLDLNHVKALLEEHENIVGIVSVDFTGRAVDLEKLRAIADEKNIWIIQDSCHSPGGYFIDSENKNQLCGNGKFADLSIFSFHPVKHIACGEGGMVTTNNKNLFDRICELRTHGITKETARFNSNRSYFKDGIYPQWYYEMQNLGYNYRLTDIQAALGISQLKKAQIGLSKRKDIAKRYTEFFSKKEWITNMSGMIEGHAYHLFIIEVENRDELYNFLRNLSIYTQVHYFPLHLMPFYENSQVTLPNSEKYIKGCLSLPMYPELSIDQQKYVMDSITSFYE